ncbi:MAG: preprotein translocase subunit SecY [Paludibacteraceae bacterium]|nr:preprotein translocase subunit SecY [Paludibacteraceae bacterium]
MRKFVETIRNIFKIEELRQRLGITILLVLVYRLGSFIVLPGVDVNALNEMSSAASNSAMMSLLDMFSGGAFTHASIFALGIMPYISASIIVQLLGMVIPKFKKWQMEGESGRRELNKITRWLTVAILIIQGSAYIISMTGPLNLPASLSFRIISVIILSAGSMFVLWLGERITERGIGNGVSFIIMIGIIARFPRAIAEAFSDSLSANGAGGLVLFLAEIIVLVLVIAGAIMLVQGVRRVPIQYAKRVEGNRVYGGVRQYLPLKVNAANVMPIIFAQALMLIPASMSTRLMSAEGGGFWASFMDSTSFWYNFVLFVLIFAFTYFYTAIMINPMQISEDLKKNNGFVPGVKPGRATAEYIDTIMSRITLPGALFLGVVAIMPAFASLFGVTTSFAQFFGGTSLIIMVGVILDTLQQIESYLLMRHYDGLMESGKIKGRGSIGAY